MSVVKIENTQLVRNEAKEVVSQVAVNVTDGACIDFSNKSDGRILLLFTNAGSAQKKVTILKGNSVQGVEDLEFSVPASKTFGIVIESGKFANVFGDNAGYVVVKGESADIKVQAIELP